MILPFPRKCFKDGVQILNFQLWIMLGSYNSEAMYI